MATAAETLFTFGLGALAGWGAHALWIHDLEMSGRLCGLDGLDAAVCGHRYGKLTYQKKKHLPASAFALPGRRYPMPDAGHASNAKARAKQALNRGTLTQSEYKTVVRKADTILRRCGGVY